MKYVVTGANGQLGKALKRRTSSFHELIALSKNDLDVTNESMVHNVLTELKPDVVVHAAAYTKVDLAEEERTQAFQVNAVGTFHIAKACEEIGATMMYISSDYVFDGLRQAPYTEEDQVNPLSMYGVSKWLGEEFVEMVLKNHYIVRTSWLYGHGGFHFVEAMLKCAFAGKGVNVVSDQVGSPTYIEDLVDVMERLLDGKPYGKYHVQNSGSCTWFEFAKEIYQQVGCDPLLVKPTSTKEFGAKAPRPAFSQLSLHKLETIGIKKPRHWKDGLTLYLQREGLL
ncbi:dTDP-4-dehydrorhamnose reductase [Halalkalibacter hemicellulosilyticus]|uniref:dTDP-4-dehydrorhamnose reductase n=1 Tax=Halalkalibacter hemicellulosilyticusJCM 9152 TaxID=1236971 RepID=W4QHZ3_9BACI|nr:dTDP-4-dehydrorhamnose reductase [Halalkalibacter hemicellulosilyticus]GAE30924.1 dTDP-4-dehydrorhamnose reductase [Halalkalibacter hemicellulosilyticusJCM 9152]